MRIVLTLLLIFFCVPGYAATFKSVTEIQWRWIYTFTVKEGSLSKEELLTIMKSDCSATIDWVTGKHFIDADTGKRIGEKPTNCFDTEVTARAAAQKEADGFEKNMEKRRAGHKSIHHN